MGITLEFGRCQDGGTRQTVHAKHTQQRAVVAFAANLDELLRRDGKEKLAHDILREVSRPLGFSVPETPSAAVPGTTDGSKAAKTKDKDKSKKRTKTDVPDNPVRRVLFSGFIIR